MKERPILFSGAMVRAILAGQKTQTRRIVHPWRCKNAPLWSRLLAPDKTPAFDWEELLSYGQEEESGLWGFGYDDSGMGEPENDAWVRCPYGEPGDHLYVRETWAWPGEEEVIYRADQWAVDMVEKWKTDPNYPQVKWKPAIHMPRKHSRIMLEVTSIKVERLQDISEEDAKAEGVERSLITGMYHPTPFMGEVHAKLTARQAFESLWKDINGPESWQQNSWVWTISFKPVEAWR